MNNRASPAAIDDIGAYTDDKVRAMLKAACWYVRLRRPDKVERLLALAIDLAENRGGMHDPALNRILDDYL